MGRNHRQLTVFQKADELAILVYRLTAKFPSDERFELRSQIRRAAISTPTNIVEGCARETRRDYARFLDIACGSANEVAYLLHLAERLSLVEPGLGDECRKRAEEVVRMLQKLITAVRRLPDS